MLINRRVGTKVLFLAAMAASLAAIPLRAATIEVEQEDEDLSSSPTPAATAVPQAPAAQPTGPASRVSAPAAAADETAPATRRVRVSDNVGFYYFVKAGYVADPDKVSSIGTVVGSLDYNLSYSTAKSTFIEVDAKAAPVSVGDLLVVYRADKPMTGADSESPAFQIENLAIVKVLEVQKRHCRVEVVKSFEPFVPGNKVEPYENEIRRWKQAQVKKGLPARPMKCLVAGGTEQGEQQSYNQLDFVFLSAGSKKGVVEGQTFRLRKVTDRGLLEDPLRSPVGKAQVIFVGPDFSTAQILSNSEPIEVNDEADYQP